MRTKLVVFVLSALVAVLVSPSGAQADHSWGNYHWARTSNPFAVKLGDNLSSVWKPYLGTTSSDWSKSSVLDTTTVPGSTRARRCRPPSGRVEVCNDTYGQNGWLGVAGIYISGSHITAGYVKLNDTYFNTSKYNTPAWRNLVMCQEVGHTLGLDHQDENFDNPNLGTCMDYTNNPDSNQYPNQHDYAQLETIYAHLDSTTTVGAAAPDSQAQIGDDARTWGTEVEGSRAQGYSKYVRSLGDGNLAITFVTWA